MTDKTHPITPPPELVERLRSEAPHGIRDAGVTRERDLIAAAYRAGADQELEACVEWVTNTRAYDMTPGALRAARRPKPPNLKEQALKLLDDTSTRLDAAHENTIRRALERLQELEDAQ